MRDEDLDNGIEEEEEEQELELEDGNVEYVSDLDEEEDDLGDLEDWLDAEDGQESGSEENDEEESGDSEGGSSEDDEEVKKASAGLKRKRAAPPSKPKKKGPRMEIEYEEEITAPIREALYA